MGLDQQARNFPGFVNTTPSATTPTHAMEETPGTTENFHLDAGSSETDANTPKDSSQNWQTPNARDWKSETGSENNSYDKTPNLSRQVYRLSHPDPAIPDGPASSERGQTSRRRLNPRFVEWLMGFPLSWTELCPTAPKDSVASATPSSRRARSGSRKKFSSLKKESVE
jgi:hypothetical protein